MRFVVLAGGEYTTLITATDRRKPKTIMIYIAMSECRRSFSLTVSSPVKLNQSENHFCNSRNDLDLPLNRRRLLVSAIYISLEKTWPQRKSYVRCTASWNIMHHALSSKKTKQSGNHSRVDWFLSSGYVDRYVYNNVQMNVGLNSTVSKHNSSWKCPMLRMAVLNRIRTSDRIMARVHLIITSH